MGKQAATAKYGINWNHHSNDDGTWSQDSVQSILLQEVRDELKKLNTLLGCRNFLDIPTRLRAIDRKLAVKKDAR